MRKNMIRKILFIIAIVGFVNANAQDINTLFIGMPDSISPLLTKVNRQDFADFLASDMKAEVKNRFGGNSEMLELTNDYLKINTTSVSSEEMKLLPVNDSVKVICLVRTFKAPAADSDIKFYSTDWKELPSEKFLKFPEQNDFYITSPDSIGDVANKADMSLIKAELSLSDNIISFYFTTPDYLDKESAEELKKYVSDKPLVYRWREGRFVKE